MLGRQSVAQSLLACMGLPRRTGSTCDRCPSRGQPGTTGGKGDKREAISAENVITVHLSLQGQISLWKKLWFLPM